jgi:hypothetical protein
MVVVGEEEHVFALHPLLTLVPIPGAGLGYRVKAGSSIAAGEVLLTESSFCTGPLSTDDDDEAAVSQFLARVQTWGENHLDRVYPGNLSVATLTTAPQKTTTTRSQSASASGREDGRLICGTTEATEDDPSSSPTQTTTTTTTTPYPQRAWIKACLHNNMYQCRRQRRHVALFVALARFNHSCTPNALNDACTDRARVRAVCNLVAGEHVTISYVPLSHDLRKRSAALSTFGFTCACARCVRERAADPCFATPCEACGDSRGICTRSLPLVDDGETGNDSKEGDYSDPFSTARMATPCLGCGSTSVLEGTDVEERHEAVVAANHLLQQPYTAVGEPTASRRRTAEAALLLAPFATHPATLHLHRSLVRLLEQQDRSDKSNTSRYMLVQEQLREIQGLEQAHGGASHRDLHFLRCFARLVKQCRRRVKTGGGEGTTTHSTDDDDDDMMRRMRKHVETRWVNLCRLHFGENEAPVTFMADTDDDEMVVQYVPIGVGGERLALWDGDDEIDLSGHEIGDEGCNVLCRHLGEVAPLRSLDLDSNGLSSLGGIALATALVDGTAPLLTHLDLMCNSIGSAGACALAAALQTPNCSRMTYLDLHGNDIGDEGCAALGNAFSTGAGVQLKHLNLSANDIDDRGCAALSLLFRGMGNSGGKMLAHLDLSDNFIQNSSFLFGNSTEVESKDAALTSSLQCIDLSWNCINDFEPLQAVFTSPRSFIALARLKLEGNAISDRACNRFCAKLKASGATPVLEYEESDGDLTESSCDDQARLQQCLRSLADGETINPRVCADEIWRNEGTAATEFGAEPTALSSSDTTASKCRRQECLERDGYFVVPRLFPQWCAVSGGGHHAIEALASTMDRLDHAGWPPVFCFMQDAVWDLISTSLWDEMRLLLGDDCVLEPSFFAWSLKPATTSNGQIGQSFGLPHRDYPASEAMFDDGKTPKLLNVWIPINDATLDNGCMYILPKEFDTQFARPDDYAHMRAATAVKGAAVCKLRFPLNGARAVPAVAGSLLSWCGNTIHWGGSCSQHSAASPRKSIAMTFRRRSVAQLEGAGEPITQESARTMSANMRLALIARSLLLYNQWHTLKSSAVPPVIYDVTRT